MYGCTYVLLLLQMLQAFCAFAIGQFLPRTGTYVGLEGSKRSVSDPLCIRRAVSRTFHTFRRIEFVIFGALPEGIGYKGVGQAKVSCWKLLRVLS